MLRGFENKKFEKKMYIYINSLLSINVGVKHYNHPILHIFINFYSCFSFLCQFFLPFFFTVDEIVTKNSK